MSEITWVDWSALQERVPEDERQSLQQTFSQLALPADNADTPYESKAAENVQATLQTLERAGQARSEGDRVWVSRAFVPDVFQKYLDV